MADTDGGFTKNLRKFTFRALKATIKGALFYAFYFVLWMFLAPFSELIPGLQQMVETFVIVYIILMVIGELASDTIFQYFFNAAKALFVISYFVLSLNGGIFGMTFENVSLTIDIRLFLVVAMLLGLLGFAKSVIQAVNYMNTRAEYKSL
ncbi:MAG: hypothetical protein OEY22_09430 [Candidatus Bathyarchaeota archaeon]|nr:hypothetical protein [Candidatus Bathyarchaeota archaeon]MDH5788731.1 hypothetical protein [Candidatus Bathyarchaeota archaeon]